MPEEQTADQLDLDHWEAYAKRCKMLPDSVALRLIAEIRNLQADMDFILKCYD